MAFLFQPTSFERISCTFQHRLIIVNAKAMTWKVIQFMYRHRALDTQRLAMPQNKRNPSNLFRNPKFGSYDSSGLSRLISFILLCCTASKKRFISKWNFIFLKSTFSSTFSLVSSIYRCKYLHAQDESSRQKWMFQRWVRVVAKHCHALPREFTRLKSDPSNWLRVNDNIFVFLIVS